MAQMNPEWSNGTVDIYQGDCLDVMAKLPSRSIHCVVTSPPYWGLRDYGIGDDALGLEPTPELYVKHLVEIFREVRRVLRDDGTLWLNLGDSYAGSGRGPSTMNSAQEMWSDKKPPDGLKPKDLVGIPWRVAFALQADGWYLRSDIIWSKPNPMPESVTDRPTKSHEYLFLLTKNQRYYYDADAIREPHVRLWDSNNGGGMSTTRHHDAHIGGSNRHERKYPVPNPLGRNKRTVWTVATQPYQGAHFATFPTKLIEPCILAGCPEDGAVLDPFAGSGTVGEVSQRFGRKSILIELNPEYVKLARKRIEAVSLPMNLA